jgi:hypothetical protein
MRALGSMVTGTALLAACLPTSEIVHTHDTVLRTREVSSAPEAPVYRMQVADGETRLALTVAQSISCIREKRQSVHRVKETEVTTNIGLHALVYVLGLAGMGIGAGLIYTNAETQTSTDPTMIGSDITSTEDKLEGIALGIGVAAVGTVLFLVATGSSLNALDRESDLGVLEVPVEGSRTLAVCDHGPAAALPLGLVVARPGAASKYIALGQTDARGRLDVAWSAVTAKLPLTAAAVDSAGIVAGEQAEVETSLANGVTPTLLAIVALPVHDDPEKAWAVALTANTPDAYRAFRDKFPASPHVADAITRAREATSRVALAEFERTLANNDLDGAARALATLRAEGDPAIAMAAGSRYEALRHSHDLEQVQRELPAALADLDTAADPAMSVATARSLVEQMRALATDDATVAELGAAQAKLTAARAKLTARLVREGTTAYGERDFETGNARFQTALLVTTDAPAVDRARAAAVGAAVQRGHAEARRLAAGGNYNDALDLLDVLSAAAPDDASLAADHAKWDASAKRAADAERAKMERDMKTNK